MKLYSDNHFLEASFQWATEKTKQFVVTGTKNGAINLGDGKKWYGPDGIVLTSSRAEWAEPKDYAPCFWAGYFDRTAYYIRDFAHQAVGAHLAGLDCELYNMFHTFAKNANEKTGWYAPWAFNFDNSVYFMDTPNLTRFVREITAQFELVEKSYELYLWTGDRRYICDEQNFLFIEKIMSDFIDLQDGIILDEKNGIPEGKGDIFDGSCTYNERSFHAAEAGDSIAAMYKALLCYSKILKIRGDEEKSQIQLKRAENLKDYFNNEWSVVPNSDKFCYAIDNKGKKHYKWLKIGKEIHGGASLIFIPMKEITEIGERNNKLLDYIFKKEKNPLTREDNIESLTYLPEVFFPYFQNDRAWYWMKHIIEQKDLPHERASQGTNGDYPEISFTFIAQTVQGIMGISVNAEKSEITTYPHFPNEINEITLTDLVFGKNIVDITLCKDSATITNKSQKPIKWTCKLPDKTETVTVDGMECKQIVN